MTKVITLQTSENQQSKLQRGTRVINLYGDEGIVTRYYPGTTPVENIGDAGIVLAGGGYADVLYPESLYINQRTPEAIIGNPPWRILEDLAPEQEIQELEAKLHDNEIKESERADKLAMENQQAIEAGRPIIEASMPAWAIAVIVAEYETDQCDSQSDYFATSTGPRYILAWSKTKRDLFPEMRKAAANFEETKHLSVRPAVEKDRQFPSDEHREKHSMGHGYYLKASHRYASGWVVRKEWISRDKLEWLYLAAGSGRFKVPCKKQIEIPEPQPRTEGVMVKINEDKNGIEIYFDAKPDERIRSKLKLNGFRFHRHGVFWYARQSDQRLSFATSLAC